MATNLKSPQAEFGTFIGVLKDEKGLLLLAYGTAAASGGANKVAAGCIAVNQTNGAVYTNTGTSSSPSWTLQGTVSAGSVGTTELAAGGVTLAKLAAGITPSHVVKYAGTITWSGSGASLATTVTGVAATDVVVATIQTAPTQAAYLKSVAAALNTITINLSASNTSNDCVISYQVLRAAA